MVGHPSVFFRLPDGSEVCAIPGDLVGRLARAEVSVPDPRVSEAHALVTLRGTSLRLVALSGALEVDGRRMLRVALRAGQVIGLAVGVAVEVLRVVLPERVWAVRREGGEVVPLIGAVVSVLGGGALVPGLRGGAAAVLWSDERGWWWRAGDAAPRRVEEGAVLVGEQTFGRLVTLELGAAGIASTEQRGRLTPPLVLRLGWDSARIEREGAPPVVVDGMGARLLAELHAMGGAAPWDAVAGELWPDEPDRGTRRRRWDVLLYELRRALRHGGVRSDLLRSHARGSVELSLLPGDEVVGT